MASIPLIPNWFINYELIFEFAFAIITLLVSLYSFKVYRLSEQKKSRTFGAAFLLISISYFIQAFINFAIRAELNERVLNIIELKNLIAINNISIFFHMMFFIFGLVTLIYMILGGKNRLLYIISLAVSALFIFASANAIFFFYIFSSLLLIFILSDYVHNHFKKKADKALFVTIAFFCLLIGQLQFIFLANNPIFWIVGNFLELIAYVFILINLLRVIKK